MPSNAAYLNGTPGIWSSCQLPPEAQLLLQGGGVGYSDQPFFSVSFLQSSLTRGCESDMNQNQKWIRIRNESGLEMIQVMTLMSENERTPPLPAVQAWCMSTQIWQKSSVVQLPTEKKYCSESGIVLAFSCHILSIRSLWKGKRVYTFIYLCI